MERGIEKALFQKTPVDDVLAEMCTEINKIITDYESQKQR